MQAEGFLFAAQSVEDKAGQLASDGLGKEAGNVEVAVRIVFAFFVEAGFGHPSGVEGFV